MTRYTRDQIDRALDATAAMLRRRVRHTAGPHAPIEAYGAAWRRWGWLDTTWKNLSAMRATTPRAKLTPWERAVSPRPADWLTPPLDRRRRRGDFPLATIM